MFHVGPDECKDGHQSLRERGTCCNAMLMGGGWLVHPQLNNHIVLDGVVCL